MGSRRPTVFVFFTLLTLVAIASQTSPLWAQSDGRIAPRLTNAWQAPTTEDLAAYLAAAQKKEADLTIKKRQKLIDGVKSLLEGGAKGPTKARLFTRLGKLYGDQGNDAYAAESAQYSQVYQDFLDERGKDSKAAAPKPDHSRSKSFYLKAVDSYRNLIAEFPKYNGKPKVLLQLGMLLALVDSPNALPTFQKIIADHGKTATAGRAALGSGNVLAAAGKLEEAKKAFIEAAKSKDPLAQAYGKYRLAWLSIKDEKKPPGAAEISILRDLSDKGCGNKGKSAAGVLCDAARDDLVFVWANQDQQKDAKEFFSGQKDLEHYYLTLERMAALRLAKQKPSEAAMVYAALAKEAPKWDKTAAIYIEWADASALANDVGGVADALAAMNSNCIQDGAWKKAQAANEALQRQARDQFQLKTRAYAQRFLAQSTGKNGPESLQASIRLLALYLDGFPTGDESYAMRFAFAEALAKANRIPEAAKQYYLVAKVDDKKARYREPAAEKMLVMQFQVMQTDKTPPPAPANWGKLKAPQNIPDNKEQLIKVIDLFADVFPAHKQLSDLRLKAAAIQMDYGMYKEGEKRIDALSKAHPDANETVTGIKMILALHSQRQEWDDLIRWSKGFLARQELKNPQLRLHIKANWRQGQWERAEGLVTAKKPEAAAKAYMTFQETFTDDKDAPLALVKASTLWLGLGQGKDGIKPCMILAKDYSTSPFRAPCLYTAASTYEQLAEFENAASVYGKFALDYPKDEKSPQALFKAGMLFADGQNTDLAAIKLRELAQAYPNTDIGAAGLLRLGDMQADLGEGTPAVVAYDQFAAKYDKTRIDDSLYAAARAAVIVAKRDEKTGSVRLKNVEARLLPTAPTVGKKARSVIAQRRFEEARFKTSEFLQNGVPEGDLVNLTAAVTQIRAELKLAEALYGMSIVLKDAEYAAASHYQLGNLYETALALGKFTPRSRDLEPAEVEKAITLREALLLDAQTGMKSHWDQAYALSGGVTTAGSNNRLDPWFRLTRKKLAKLSPGKYVDAPEMMLAPTYTSHKISQSH